MENKTVDEVIESIGNEKNELDEKITRLNVFLYNNIDCNNWSKEYYLAIVNQLHSMEIYSNILEARLEMLKAGTHRII